MSKLPELALLLSYENELVIKQYCKDHPDITPEQAKQIFQDLLGWFWVSVFRLRKKLKTPMLTSLLRLDHMWHVFILHTRMYADFCRDFLGEYFHHEVEAHDQESVISPDELSEFLSDCYDHLGEAWVVRNFG